MKKLLKNVCIDFISLLINISFYIFLGMLALKIFIILVF